ncbi:hypothetical protein HHI36_010357, partial [Cryptolaemus montrouzieri]
ALAAARVTGAIIYTTRDISSTRRQPNTPQWEGRLTNKFKALQCDIGQLPEYLRNPKSARVQRSAQLIIGRVQQHSQQDPSNTTADQSVSGYS